MPDYMKYGTGSALKPTLTLSAINTLTTTWDYFSFDAPLVSYSVDANAAASGGSSVTISGLNFRSSSPSPSATLLSGKELCSTVGWTSGTTVSCGLAVPSSLSVQYGSSAAQ